MIAYVHTIGGLWNKCKKLWNNKKIYLYFTGNGTVRIKQVGNNPYKSIIHVNNLRALFPEEQIPCLEIFRYLQAVVFVSNLCSFSILLGFSNSVMYLAIFWWGSFFYALLMTFVNGLIASFICSFCCSAAL